HGYGCLIGAREGTGDHPVERSHVFTKPARERDSGLREMNPTRLPHRVPPHFQEAHRSPFRPAVPRLVCACRPLPASSPIVRRSARPEKYAAIAAPGRRRPLGASPGLFRTVPTVVWPARATRRTRQRLWRTARAARGKQPRVVFVPARGSRRETIRRKPVCGEVV